MTLHRAAFVLAVLAVAGCGDDGADYLEVVERAVKCNPGDTCVLVITESLPCGELVNARSKSEVEAAAAGLPPFVGRPMCTLLTNPRCEGGKCVADQCKTGVIHSGGIVDVCP